MPLIYRSDEENIIVLQNLVILQFCIIWLFIQ